MRYKNALCLALMLCASGCAKSQNLDFCPAYPQPGKLVAADIVALFDKYEQTPNEMTALEFERILREDALFKLEDQLSLCK